MTLEQMKAQLGMEIVPEVFETLYEQVKDTWQELRPGKRSSGRTFRSHR